MKYLEIQKPIRNEREEHQEYFPQFLNIINHSVMETATEADFGEI